MMRILNLVVLLYYLVIIIYDMHSFPCVYGQTTNIFFILKFLFNFLRERYATAPPIRYPSLAKPQPRLCCPLGRHYPKCKQGVQEGGKKPHLCHICQNNPTKCQETLSTLPKCQVNSGLVPQSHCGSFIFGSLPNINVYRWSISIVSLARS